MNEHKVIFGPLAMVLLLLLALLLLLLLKAFGFLNWPKREEVLPRSAPAGNRASRIAEAIVLLCAGAAVFVFTATNRSTGGWLSMLDNLHPKFAVANVAIAACVGVGVLLAILICLTWRTWAAVIMMATVLCIYGWVLNGPDEYLYRLAAEVSDELNLPYTIYTNSSYQSQITGVDLWVNGVYLGETPVRTTADEFKNKVPYWPEPPEELEDNADIVGVPEYSEHGVWHRKYHKWIEFTIPKAPEPRDSRHKPRLLSKEVLEKREAAQEAERKLLTYYAKVKLGDEWGLSRRRANTGRGSGGVYWSRGFTQLFVLFPDRQNRLDKLLDKARLADYEVDADWYRAIETYEDDGWRKLLEAAEKEPQMKLIFDNWARWKYGLDKVTDEKTAWKAFKAVCDEVNALEKYSTASIAGRTVELLVPYLDAETLIRQGEELIHSKTYYAAHWARQYGRFQFSRRAIPSIVGLRRVPPHAYAVAHAIWKLDELLDSQNNAESNIVERQISPALICWNYDNVNRLELRIACCLGGPDIERFLLRQNWRANAKNLPWGQEMHIGGEEVNGWLYLLANLRSTGGRRFRQKHNHRVMQMADIAFRYSHFNLSEELNFLFLDLDLGERSLAAKYWPRFRELARQRRYDGLRLQFEYLIRMEPVSTPAMYAEAWRSYRGDYDDCYTAFDAFGRTHISLDKRKEILSALTREIEADVSNLKGEENEDKLRRRLLQNLKGELLPWDDNNEAEHILSQLREGSRDYEPDEIAAWLEHEEPDHPLVQMLAGSRKLELRLLVMEAIRAHPTPQNREVLQKLLNDEYEKVRTAAEEVAAELKKLADMPVKKLVAVPSVREVQ